MLMAKAGCTLIVQVVMAKRRGGVPLTVKGNTTPGPGRKKK